MTETEKLDAGLEYDFWDPGVNERKLDAIRFWRTIMSRSWILCRLRSAIA